MTRHAARSRPPLVLLVILAVLLPGAPGGPAAVAAEAAGPAGHWEGGIDLPGAKLVVDVDLATKDGAWSGDISIPAQGASNLPLGGVRVEGSSVAFAIAGVPGDPTFKGTLAADGSSIAGDFTQGGQTFPFRLDRAAEPAAAAAEALAGFDDVVAAALKDFEVPGIGLAIVRNGAVALAKGYGTRDTAKGLPVTADTLFAIGSSTKAFTTFAMGTLVDEGLLDWDRPVAGYLPFFRMKDPMATLRLTPRDLVTHRSGMPRHDLVWYNNASASRKELVARLADLEPYRDLRVEFHYQNLMFLTAGYLIETITGRTWEESIRERILEPAGMTNTNFSVSDSQRSPDFARGYREKDEKILEMPFREIGNMGPAGSINSSANDMARWLMLQLGDGTVGGKRLLNDTTLRDMHTPRTPISVSAVDPETPTISYGLGWFVEPYRGRMCVHHGGNIDGFSALVWLMPRDGMGIVVLANANGTPLPDLLAKTITDRVLDLETKDWLGEAKARREKGKEARKEAEAKKKMAQRPGTKPAHALAEYAGLYANPGYGSMTVELKGDRLEATYNGLRTPLEHWHYEVFNGLAAGEETTFEDMKFTFVTNVKGDVDAVQVPFEPEVADIVFTRRPDAALSDPVYLGRFVGEYELSGQVVSIAVRGGGLIVTVPGQPTYDLVAYRTNEFTLKQVSVISVRFTVDAKGVVTEAIFDQPNGMFTAKRIEKK